MRTIVKVGRQGRAMIPFDVRKQLGIDDGDRLVIEIKSVIHPNESDSASKGSSDKGCPETEATV